MPVMATTMTARPKLAAALCCFSPLIRCATLELEPSFNFLRSTSSSSAVWYRASLSLLRALVQLVVIHRLFPARSALAAGVPLLLMLRADRWPFCPRTGRGLSHLVEYNAQAEDIAALIHLLAPRLFRRHVLHSAHQQAGGDIDVITGIDFS